MSAIVLKFATSPFDKSVHRFSNTGILTDSEIDLFFRFRIQRK
eukprot:COSAG02_NODE_173_length_31245_cov_413.548096_31_plen_43_part_00